MKGVKMSAILCGNRVKDFRNRAGLSQEELAYKCDVTRSTIAHIENNTYDSVPSLELVDKMALAMDCTIYDLFELMSSYKYRRNLDDQRREATRAALESVTRYASAMNG